MPIYRVYYKIKDDKVEYKEYPDRKSLLAAYEQIGVEETSYQLRLHNEPILRGLVGPLCEESSKKVVRYESPEVFVKETEKWSKKHDIDRKRSS